MEVRGQGVSKSGCGGRGRRSCSALTISVRFLLQDVSGVALTQAPPLACSIAVSDLSPGRDSVSLKVSTPGQNCSFTLVSLDSGEDGSECRRRTGGAEITAGGREEEEEEVGGDHLGGGVLLQERSAVFTCLMDHLEAGTSYQLQIRSQNHQHVLNVTMATSKSQPPPLQLQLKRRRPHLHGSRCSSLSCILLVRNPAETVELFHPRSTLLGGALIGALMWLDGDLRWF